MTANYDVKRGIDLLHGWLARRLSADQVTWIDEHSARIAAAPASNALTIAVGLASRRVGKQPLALSDGRGGDRKRSAPRAQCR